MTGLTRAWLLPVALALAAPAIAAEQKQPEAAPPARPPEVQSTTPNRRDPDRASTFTPSEKIKADSSVSFPVDI